MSEITDTARDRMEKCLEALKTNFGKVRTAAPTRTSSTPSWSTTTVSQRP